MRGSIRCQACSRRLAECTCRANVWELRVNIGRDPITGKYRQRSRTVHGGKREAERALTELIADVDRGRHRGSATTLAYLLDRWVEDLERQERSPSTIRAARRTIDAAIVPALGQIQLRRLTAHDLDVFYGQLSAKGLAPATVRRHHALIAAALSTALRWGWVSENVAKLARPPAARPKEIEPPTAEQVRRLLAAAVGTGPQPHDLASMLVVTADTGARRGELCAVQWGDVDLAAGVLVIRRAIVDVPGAMVEKDTKTHQVRRVLLGPLSVSALTAHRARMEQRAGHLPPEAYVWSQEIECDLPWRPDKVTGWFRRLRAKVGLEDVNFHHLRHFMASQLLGAGHSVTTVAARGGWGDGGRTLLRVYAHPIAEAERKAADHMGELLAVPDAGGNDEAAAGH